MDDMIKFFLFLVLSLNVLFANPLLCINSYNSSNPKNKITAKTITLTFNTDADRIKQNENAELYFSIIKKAVEMEFSLKMEPFFERTLKKLIFYPHTMTDEQIAAFQSGNFSPLIKVNKSADEFASLKSFFNNPQLINFKQKRLAEDILSKHRALKLPISLNNIEMAALRFSKAIGRDLRLLNSSEQKITENILKELKFNFLRLFKFGGKELSKEEFEVLFNERIIRDDPFNDTRWDYAETYEGQVKSAWIREENFRTLSELTKKLDFTTEKLLMAAELDPTLKKSYEELLKDLNNLPLRESLDFIRREFFYQKHDKRSSFANAREFVDFTMEKERTFINLKRDLHELLENFNLQLLNNEIKPAYQLKTFVKKLQENQIIVGKNDNNKDILSYFNKYKGKGHELFKIFRELKESNMSINLINIENSINAKLYKLKPMVNYIQLDFGTTKNNLVHIELLVKTRINRSALTEAEAKDILRILSYTPQIRLLYAKKYDPLRRFGFCFGRAFFGNLILLNNGVRSDAIKKVFVYGPMQFGKFTRWGFHVAVMVAKEGGGYWVIDPTNGKLVTLEEWFPAYDQASTDGRLRLFISDNQRFGRNGWDTPDWQVLRAQYNSELNQLIKTDYNFFKDGIKVLADNEFSEGKNRFAKFINRIFENFGWGF